MRPGWLGSRSRQEDTNFTSKPAERNLRETPNVWAEPQIKVRIVSFLPRRVPPKLAPLQFENPSLARTYASWFLSGIFPLLVF